MTRECPACHKTYPDSRYREKDGSPLKNRGAAGGGGYWKKARWFVAPVVLSLALAAAAYVWVIARSSSVVVVLIDDVILKSDGSRTALRQDRTLASEIAERILESARIAGGSEDLIVRIRCRNTGYFQATITSARYQIEIGDKEVARGEWLPPAAVVCRRNEEIKMNLPLKIDAGNTLSSIIGVLREKTDANAIQIKGEVEVDFWITKTSIPFEARYVKTAIELDTHVN